MFYGKNGICQHEKSQESYRKAPSEMLANFTASNIVQANDWVTD